MENRETYINQPLPDVLSVEKIPELKRPQLEDWKYIQGGIPEIIPIIPGISYTIIHRYQNLKDPSGTGVIVPTSISSVEKDWGKHTTVDKKGADGKIKTFPVALLWEYHGKPCESNNRTGSRYDRVMVK